MNSFLSLGFCFSLSVLLLGTPSPVHSENVVFFVGVSSYSHRLPMWPLAEALAEKGHNVTFICPYLQKKPNPKIFDYAPQSLVDWLPTFDEMYNYMEDRKNGRLLINDWFGLPAIGVSMCNVIYKDEKFMNWVKTAKVDLLFIDGLVNECAYYWGHRWNAKVILFHTSSPSSYFIDSFGLPDESSWLPNKELGFSPEMTFPQRLANTLIAIVWELYRKWCHFPRLEDITKKYWKTEKNMPSMEEMERNISMVFINTHYGEEFPRSLPPHTISVGGIAWTGENKQPNKLPKKLEKFLETKPGELSNGFVYVSFGTFVNFYKLEESVQRAFVAAMRSFPKLKFIWKMANESIANEFPDGNVFVGKWMPQQDLLAHPEIKAFVTHSGLIGLQEAVYNAVPMISFPFFADQDYNAERIHRRECGIRLEICTVTQSQIQDAIYKVTTDPKYHNNMKRISSLFRERPQKPLETAMWWTEFVLRHSHEDLKALQPLSVNQPWWKKRGVDIWAAIFIFCTFIGILAWKIAKIFVQLFVIIFPQRLTGKNIRAGKMVSNFKLNEKKKH